MVVLGAPQVDPAKWLQRSDSISWPLLLSTLLWNTSGWDNAGCCAGEVENPNRTYPRAMIFTVLLVTAAYLLPVAVGVGIDPNSASWKEGDFPKVAAMAGGPWLGRWLTLAGLISAAGMLNALLCTSARVPFAMARRGMLPDALAAQHVKFFTPWKALLVNSIGIAALMPFSFQELIEVDMFLYAAAMILEFAALIWLRVRRPEMARPYRVPFGLAGTIAISVPPVILCLISIALANAATKWLGISAIGVGLMIYWWRTRITPAGQIEPTPTV